MSNNFLNKSNIDNEIDFFNKVDNFVCISDSFYESKYFVIEKKQKYLLIISSSNNENIITDKAAFLNSLISAGIKTHKILSYGRCNNPKYFYTIYNWIDGKSLDTYLVNQDPYQQYCIGTDCGHILKKTHNITQTKSNNCNIHYDIKRCLKNKEKYTKFEVCFPNIKRFFDILEKYENKSFSNESIAILHGDFSLSNIIINNQTLYLIDWVYGEKSPTIKEFVRNLFNSSISNNFAKGLIDGYFRESINSEMWIKLLIFTIIHQIELIDWIGLFDFVSKEFIEQQHENLIYQYNNFNCIIPLYFREENNYEY